ncbi:MAG: hypothetical protein AB7T05_10380, partial [Fimbriimonadaceae bacterium]
MLRLRLLGWNVLFISATPRFLVRQGYQPVPPTWAEYLEEFPRVGEATGDCSGGGSQGRDQMGPRTGTLTTLV